MASRETTGTVIRTVDSDLVYAVTDGADGRTLAFGPTSVAGFSGQSLAELGFHEGSAVTLAFDPQTGIVDRATSRPAPTDRRRSAGTSQQPSTSLPSPSIRASTEQNELLPDLDASGSISVSRALPPETRAFGKLLDTSKLKPGDLMLTRDLKPEWTGRAIISVQEKGGYAQLDSRWTHAAMYIGDGAHVVEATFESPLKGGSVKLTALDDYCKGEAAIRFRRPLALESDEDRWKLCIRALKRLHRPYGFAKAIELWFRVNISGSGFYDEDQTSLISNAVICSTLYADAYNEATRRSLGEIGGACVPAWLSGANEFEELNPRWLAFRR